MLSHNALKLCKHGKIGWPVRPQLGHSQGSATQAQSESTDKLADLKDLWCAAGLSSLGLELYFAQLLALPGAIWPTMQAITGSDTPDVGLAGTQVLGMNLVLSVAEYWDFLVLLPSSSTYGNLSEVLADISYVC